MKKSAFLTLLLLSLSLFGEKLVIYPNAAAFIDKNLAEQMLENIATRLEIDYDSIKPIEVFTPDDDPKAARYFLTWTPDWGIAIAVPQYNLIIMKKPQQDAIPVLAHELTHILVHRYGYEHIPLWFDEGLAEYFSGHWTRSDELKLSLLSFGKIPKLDELQSLYIKQQYRADFLYSLSYLAVSFLVSDYSERIIPEILQKSKGVDSFDDGFYLATGRTVDKFENEFRKFRRKFGLVGIVFNDYLIWFGIMLLFFAAGIIAIRRRILQERRLREEEQASIIDFEKYKDNQDNDEKDEF